MKTWVFVLWLMAGDEPVEAKVRLNDEVACEAYQATAEKVIRFTPGIRLLGVRPCTPEVEA